MASLSDEHKLFIVERLAQFDSPTDVQKALKEQFGAEATLQQLSAYDPNTVAGRRLSPELKSLFESVREAFVKDRRAIAITHASWRQKMRTDLLRRPEVLRNPVLVIKILDAGEKEEGGYHRSSSNGATPEEVAAKVEEVCKDMAEAVKQGVSSEHERTAVIESFRQIRQKRKDVGGSGG